MALNRNYLNQYEAIVDVVEGQRGPLTMTDIVDCVSERIGRGRVTISKRVHELVEADVLWASESRGRFQATDYTLNNRAPIEQMRDSADEERSTRDVRNWLKTKESVEQPPLHTVAGGERVHTEQAPHQPIPLLLSAIADTFTDLQRELDERDARIAELEGKLEAIKGALT